MGKDLGETKMLLSEFLKGLKDSKYLQTKDAGIIEDAEKFEETKHARGGKGTSKGGQFVSKGQGGGGSQSSKKEKSKKKEVAPKEEKKMSKQQKFKSVMKESMKAASKTQFKGLGKKVQKYIALVQEHPHHYDKDILKEAMHIILHPDKYDKEDAAVTKENIGEDIEMIKEDLADEKESFNETKIAIKNLEKKVKEVKKSEFGKTKQGKNLLKQAEKMLATPENQYYKLDEYDIEELEDELAKWLEEEDDDEEEEKKVETGGKNIKVYKNVYEYFKGVKDTGKEHFDNPKQKEWEKAIKRDDELHYLMDSWKSHGGTDWQDGKKLKEMFDKAPPFNGTVFRGIDVTLKVENFKVGRTFTFKKHASTSRKKDTAIDFMESEDSGTLFRIDLKRGAAIERISGFGEEKEVVAKKGTKIKITSSFKHGNFMVIEGKEI